MCREKLFSDVLDITAFLDYKDINTNRLQTLHFSKVEENPVVGDLVRVFEEHYTSSVPSRPIKLGRRNTYGPESSGESHLVPTRRTLNASGSETTLQW